MQSQTREEKTVVQWRDFYFSYSIQKIPIHGIIPEVNHSQKLLVSLGEGKHILEHKILEFCLYM